MLNFELHKVHPSALISDQAILGKDITVGANVIIYDHVQIGDGVVIGPNSILGEPGADYYHNEHYTNPTLTIGDGTLIRSGAIIYAGTCLGEECELGHRVTIREQSIIGHHVRIGTLSDVLGHCEIGNYSRLHSNVFVAPDSIIGQFVWIFPHAVITNDPTPPSNWMAGAKIDNFAVLCAHSVIMPGINVGTDALVGAGALVNRDVKAETVVVGIPARPVGNIRDVISKITHEPAYPWREHFDRGLPWEGMGYDVWKESQV